MLEVLLQVMFCSLCHVLQTLYVTTCYYIQKIGASFLNILTPHKSMDGKVRANIIKIIANLHKNKMAAQ